MVLELLGPCLMKRCGRHCPPRGFSPHPYPKAPEEFPHKPSPPDDPFPFLEGPQGRALLPPGRQRGRGPRPHEPPHEAGGAKRDAGKLAKRILEAQKALEEVSICLDLDLTRI